MKLIIDIDDNVFTRLFDNGVDTSSDDREVIDRAVRNGMPYAESPQGDLISREALKEELEEIVCIEPIFYQKTVFETIDNAPPVTDRTEEVLSLQNTIAKLVEGISENARPQGEWLFHRCSLCGQYDARDNENFCSNCGADMKSDIQKSCYTCKYKAGCPKSEVCQECRGFDHYEKAVQK